MTLVPELLVQKCQFPLHIQAEHERFNRQENTSHESSKFFVVSTTKLYEMGVTFALFHHLMCTRYSIVNRALVVYHDDDELAEWMRIVELVFARKRRALRFLVVDDALQNVYTNASMNTARTHLFVFVRRSALLGMFPVGADITAQLRPFMTSDECVVTAMRNIHVPVVDSRCISPGDPPLLSNAPSSDRFNAYAHLWSSVFFTSKGFVDKENIYDINMLAITQYRFCVVDVSIGDEIRMSNVRCILNHSDGTINSDILGVLRKDKYDYECIPEDSLTDIVRYFQMYDTPVTDMSNLVVFKNKRHRSTTSSSSSSSSQLEDHTSNDINTYSGLNELKSIVDYNTQDGLAQRTEINSNSRYSMLAIYDKRIIEITEKLGKYANKKHFSEVFTDENNVHLKCATIIAYTMANLHTPFYLVCPYISSVHPLMNIVNVRCMHITDVNEILSIEEEYTLIVFDTYFVNQPKNAKIFRDSRCHLLFATFQHTQEEEELQKFVAKKPLCTWKRWMTEAPFFCNDGFSMNTESIFRMVPAHFTNVSAMKTHSTIYNYLREVYENFEKSIEYAYIVDTEEIVRLESEELEDAADDLWDKECCTSVIMTPEEQRCFAYANIEQRRHELRVGLRPLIPSKNFEVERRELLDEIRTSEYMQRHMQIFSRLVPREEVRDLKITREARSRLAEVRDQIAAEKRKRDERVLAFLREETRSADYRVRITCNVDYRNYISSVSRPPIPNDCTRAIVQEADVSNECKVCLYKSSRPCNYQRHLYSRKHKQNLKALKNTVIPLQRTMATYYCEHCDIQMRAKSDFDRHVVSRRHVLMVAKNDIVQCSLCDHDPFTDKETYAIHLASAHSEDVHVSCNACNVEVLYSTLTEHLKTREHRELVEDGPWQRYCKCCDEYFSEAKLMQKHNKTSAHLTRMPTTVNPSNPFITIEVQLNRFILAFAVDNHFINRSLFTDTHVFNSVVNAKSELRQSQDYITLMLISACISPTRRSTYKTEDGLAGFTVLSFKNQMGILGAFNEQHSGFVALLARFIKEFSDVFCYLEYYPAYLESEIEAAISVHNGRIIYTQPHQSRCIPPCPKSYRAMQFLLP